MHEEWYLFEETQGYVAESTLSAPARDSTMRPLPLLQERSWLADRKFEVTPLNKQVLVCKFPVLLYATKSGLRRRLVTTTCFPSKR